MLKFETCQQVLQLVFFFTDWFSMDNVMAAINNSEGFFYNKCSLCPAFMFDPQAKRQ